MSDFITMTDSQKELHDAVSAVLADREVLTAQELKDKISLFLPVFPKLSSQDGENIARIIEQRRGIRVGLTATLEDKDFVHWLEGAKRNGLIDPYYWNRYRTFMLRRNIPESVVFSTDRVTDDILNHLGNPRDDSRWKRMGMVVGNVQSGKTSNYAGLICKALDAGYPLVIVLAGMYEDLRFQTQKRINDGVIGRNHLKKMCGVGKIDGTPSRIPRTLTNEHDFKKHISKTDTSSLATEQVPFVFVIKKNANILKALIKWLKSNVIYQNQKITEYCMLMIDDESDNASINTKFGQGEISKINRQIREVLDLFERRCYVGYTATPFANIFIDPDTEDEMVSHDLFPRHFIIGLGAPENYFGFRKIFLDGIKDDSNPEFVRYITDNDQSIPVKHRKDRIVRKLPPSLQDALRLFIISRVIRDNRGQSKQHASMLVNVSIYTDVQSNIKNLLYKFLVGVQDDFEGALSQNKKSVQQSNIQMQEFHRVWEKEYAGLARADATAKWEHIKDEIKGVVNSVKIIEMNRNARPFSYDSSAEFGETVVVVGGYLLSRGLTLEGLTISYLLRNSKMYDTLMQMARWFGYRPGYQDLCRIYMKEDMTGWYSDVSESTDELFDDLKEMERQGQAPENFGLRVRRHPGSLLITSRNKIGYAQKLDLRVKLSGRYIETPRISSMKDHLDINRMAAKKLISKISDLGRDWNKAFKNPGGFLERNVPVNIVTDFICEFVDDESNFLTNRDFLLDYIAERTESELAKWDIFVSSLRGDKEKFSTMEIQPIVRNVTVGKKDNFFSFSGASAKISPRGIEKIGVDRDAVKSAEILYRQDKNISDDERVNYPDRIYRKNRKRPLFALFPVSIQCFSDTEKNKPIDPRLPGTEEPVIGWGISFASSDNPDSYATYSVNKAMMKQMAKQDDANQDDGNNSNVG